MTKIIIHGEDFRDHWNYYFGMDSQDDVEKFGILNILHNIEGVKFRNSSLDPLPFNLEWVITQKKHVTVDVYWEDVLIRSMENLDIPDIILFFETRHKITLINSHWMVLRKSISYYLNPGIIISKGIL